jgi:hypothetical protein
VIELYVLNCEACKIRRTPVRKASLLSVILTDYHAKYFAYELTKRCASDSPEKLAGVVASAQVDLNPHQVDASLFAFNSPLSKGALLADEVGLGLAGFFFSGFDAFLFPMPSVYAVRSGVRALWISNCTTTPFCGSLPSRDESMTSRGRPIHSPCRKEQVLWWLAMRVQ